MLFCAISALGYSASVIIGQNAAVSVGEVEAAFLSRGTALLALLPFVVRERNSTSLQPRHWLGILAMGALDAVGVVAINASGHLPGKEFAAIGISAYGAIAVVLAMLVLKEKVSPGQWLGIALITGGVATLSVSE
jgi:drug/metabolite transporter (DMT)-like permease